jgi:hypothetical protein
MLVTFSLGLAISGSALSAAAFTAPALSPTSLPAPARTAGSVPAPSLAARAVSAPTAARPGVGAPPPFADRELLKVLGRIEPVPGAWAEYLVRSPRWGEGRVRVTVLPAAGDGRYWLELASVNAGGIAGAARLLVHGTGSPRPEVERIGLLLAGQQAIEIPLEQLGPGWQLPAVAEATHLGFAQVRVRAGTFAAEILGIPGTRAWRAPGVPLWGLVKARSRSFAVELLASGTSGGRSVFPADGDHGNGSESAK